MAEEIRLYRLPSSMTPLLPEKDGEVRELATELTKVDLAKQNDANELQNLVFQIGKNHGYEKNMREWFLALYQILLGQDQGPRMGSFIALFGVDNFVKLVGGRVGE
jgi:lysyl-tRNA synthetase class 1